MLIHIMCDNEKINFSMDLSFEKNMKRFETFQKKYKHRTNGKYGIGRNYKLKEKILLSM